MFFMFILGAVLYGTTVLIPQYLQLLMGYSAVSAGEALAGGGFIMMLMMPLSGFSPLKWTSASSCPSASRPPPPRSIT